MAQKTPAALSRSILLFLLIGLSGTIVGCNLMEEAPTKELSASEANHRVNDPEIAFAIQEAKGCIPDALLSDSRYGYEGDIADDRIEMGAAIPQYIVRGEGVELDDAGSLYPVYCNDRPIATLFVPAEGERAKKDLMGNNTFLSPITVGLYDCLTDSPSCVLLYLDGESTYAEELIAQGCVSGRSWVVDNHWNWYDDDRIVASQLGEDDVQPAIIHWDGFPDEMKHQIRFSDESLRFLVDIQNEDLG